MIAIAPPEFDAPPAVAPRPSRREGRSFRPNLRHGGPMPACSRCNAELSPYEPRTLVTAHPTGEPERGAILCEVCALEHKRFLAPIRTH
jgi:hypothetical protein